jgi:hypothetical protein
MAEFQFRMQSPNKTGRRPNQRGYDDSSNVWQAVEECIDP